MIEKAKQEVPNREEQKAKAKEIVKKALSNLGGALSDSASLELTENWDENLNVFIVQPVGGISNGFDLPDCMQVKEDDLKEGSTAFKPGCGCSARVIHRVYEEEALSKIHEGNFSEKFIFTYFWKRDYPSEVSKKTEVGLRKTKQGNYIRFAEGDKALSLFPKIRIPIDEVHTNQLTNPESQAFYITAKKHEKILKFMAIGNEGDYKPWGSSENIQAAAPIVEERLLKSEWFQGTNVLKVSKGRYTVYTNDIDIARKYCGGGMTVNGDRRYYLNKQCSGNFVLQIRSEDLEQYLQLLVECGQKKLDALDTSHLQKINNIMDRGNVMFFTSRGDFVCGRQGGAPVKQKGIDQGGITKALAIPSRSGEISWPSSLPTSGYSNDPFGSYMRGLISIVMWSGESANSKPLSDLLSLVSYQIEYYNKDTIYQNFFTFADIACCLYMQICALKDLYASAIKEGLSKKLPPIFYVYQTQLNKTLQDIGENFKDLKNKAEENSNEIAIMNNRASVYFCNQQKLGVLGFAELALDDLSKAAKDIQQLIAENLPKNFKTKNMLAITDGKEATPDVDPISIAFNIAPLKPKGMVSIPEGCTCRVIIEECSGSGFLGGLFGGGKHWVMMWRYVGFDVRSNTESKQGDAIFQLKVGKDTDLGKILARFRTNLEVKEKEVNNIYEITIKTAIAKEINSNKGLKPIKSSDKYVTALSLEDNFRAFKSKAEQSPTSKVKPIYKGFSNMDEDMAIKPSNELP